MHLRHSALAASALFRTLATAVPAGRYYLMISAIMNNQALVWIQAIALDAGENTITLSAANAQAMR
ncbi:MAG TPA: hypothetical protein VME68_17230 [Acidobacteriaceae bacterium]|nr:hypothetical protein [Acidobacteriaceae bacterium]